MYVCNNYCISLQTTLKQWVSKCAHHSCWKTTNHSRYGALLCSRSNMIYTQARDDNVTKTSMAVAKQWNNHKTLLVITACFNFNKVYFGSSNGGAIHSCFKFPYPDKKRRVARSSSWHQFTLKKKLNKDKQCLYELAFALGRLVCSEQPGLSSQSEIVRNKCLNILYQTTEQWNISTCIMWIYLIYHHNCIILFVLSMITNTGD